MHIALHFNRLRTALKCISINAPHLVVLLVKFKVNICVTCLLLREMSNDMSYCFPGLEPTSQKAPTRDREFDRGNRAEC